MFKHLRARREDQSWLERGFTLVELLVVIVILGILAAVVVFAVGGTEGDAKKQACLTERSVVESAVEAYKAQNSGAIPTIDDLLSAGDKSKALLKHLPTYWKTVNADGTLTGTSLPAGCTA